MKIRRWALLIPFSFLILLGGLFWPGSGKGFIEIDVRPGAPAIKVGMDLKERGHLRSIIIFKVWAKIRGAGQRTKVGRYRFSKGRSAYWIIDDLVNGRTEKVQVTIPEGFASWQIAERLALFEICGKDEFLDLVNEKKLEGFLYPATYDFDVGVGAGPVVETLRGQFDKVWSPEMEQRALEMAWTQKMVVTLASIIEREVMDRKEMPVVSSVYHNRLKRNMRLEADPTVQYALGYWKKRLLFSDLKSTHSPYNTYKVKGLPPGPICNPGRDALMAALWPAQTNFLYFVADEEGRHKFSPSYSEHLKNIRQRDQQRRSRRK